MKNIIAISDTHNRLPSSAEFWEILENADYIFHLGDGIRDIEKLKFAYPDKLVYVYGNCDHMSREEERTVEIEGVKFFLAHGHRYRAKSSDLDLQMKSIEEGAKCCVYGHTHTPQIEKYGDLTVINPGSLTYSGTYCYMSVKDGKVLAKIVNRTF